MMSLWRAAMLWCVITVTSLDSVICIAAIPVPGSTRCGDIATVLNSLLWSVEVRCIQRSVANRYQGCPPVLITAACSQSFLVSDRQHVCKCCCAAHHSSWLASFQPHWHEFSSSFLCGLCWRG